LSEAAGAPERGQIAVASDRIEHSQTIRVAAWIVVGAKVPQAAEPVLVDEPIDLVYERAPVHRP
jgi:hypothetical protein